jgi:hypothetical protein
VQFPRWSVLALLILAFIPVWGQSKSVPVLHRRVSSQLEDQYDYATQSVGRTALPSEASGEYALGGGATIDIDLQPDRLSGFITRPGDRESDAGTPLTFFFATSRLHHAASARCLVLVPGNDRARLLAHPRPAGILPAAGPACDARRGQPDRAGANGFLAPGPAKS